LDKLQQQVQQAIDQLVESGVERGVQVAVYRDGRQVVDAVARVADPDGGRAVTSGTVFYNSRSSKARPRAGASAAQRPWLPKSAPAARAIPSSAEQQVQQS
jgi:hypothetical protein